MLTIHTPIELKNDPSILTVTDAFAARIGANYEQMTAGLSPEELLHLFSAPPEIYLAEGGAHSFVDLTNNVQSQELKLSMINNVCNRVLVMDGRRTTYQDEVFIYNTLRKLGVTDVSQFVHQVKLLFEETNSRNELIDLYWSHQAEILELTANYESLRERTVKEEAEEEPQENSVLWLHEMIMNRLKTGVIYQELRNYLTQQAGSTFYLNRQELQVSEQSVSAEYILLNRLKNQTTESEVPLVYNHLNAYELGDETTYLSHEEGTVSQIVQAVLLQALDQVYALRYDEIKNSSKNVWYELANAVYETAANTFERFEAYHNRTQLNRTDIEEYHSDIHDYRQREITALKHLLERREQLLERLGEEELPPRAQLEYMSQAGDGEESQTIYRDARVTNENYIRQQNERQMLTEQHMGDVFINRQLSEKPDAKLPPQAQMEHIQQPESRQEGQTVYRDARVTNENYIRQQHEQMTREELHMGDVLLNRQMTQINEQNLARLERVQQLMQQFQQSHTDVRIDRGSARQDVLRALEQPQEVLLEYLSGQTPAESREQERKELLRNIYDEETIRIFETLERYRREPEKLLMQGIVSADPVGQMERDIQLQYLMTQQTRTQEQEHYEQQTVREVDQIRMETDRRLAEDVIRREETWRRTNRVELLHREQESALDEELLEQLRTINRQTTREDVHTNEQHHERSVVEQTVTNRVNALELTSEEELAEMVSRNIRQQLRGMSDQVYRKLEKRMDSERRRRGI